MIGYEAGQGYRLYNPETGKLLTSRDVIFDERRFLDRSVDQDKKTVPGSPHTDEPHAETKAFTEDSGNETRTAATSASKPLAQSEKQVPPQPQPRRSKRIQEKLRELQQVGLSGHNQADMKPQPKPRQSKQPQGQVTQQQLPQQANLVVCEPKSAQEVFSGPDALHWKKAADS